MSVTQITGTITHRDGTTTKFQMYPNVYGEVLTMQEADSWKGKTMSVDVLAAMNDAAAEYFYSPPMVEFRGAEYGLDIQDGNALTIDKVVISAVDNAEAPKSHGWEEPNWENKSQNAYQVSRQDGRTLSVWLEAKAGTIEGWSFVEYEDGDEINTGSMEFGVFEAFAFVDGLAEQITAWIDGGEIG